MSQPKGLIKKQNQCDPITKQTYQNQGGLLTITHDIEVAEQLGGEILVMKKGSY
ncbi:peptide transport system ATP-binding protein [Actinobacillus equuli]|nr:peptide transport system ATP-binding protein [Actinobacillus equuli]